VVICAFPHRSVVGKIFKLALRSSESSFYTESSWPPLALSGLWTYLARLGHAMAKTGFPAAPKVFDHVGDAGRVSIDRPRSPRCITPSI
jgi:hypothetical protein